MKKDIQPIVKLRIIETDEYLDAQVEVLDGEKLQPEHSPVNLYHEDQIRQLELEIDKHILNIRENIRWIDSANEKMSEQSKLIKLASAALNAAFLFVPSSYLEKSIIPAARDELNNFVKGNN